MLYLSLCYVEFFLCHVLHQCVTVRQRTARYPFVDYSAVYYFCAFFSIFHCSNLYFFMLHFFHNASFPCCTFLCSNHFMLHFLYVLHYFMLHFFTRCKVFILHSSPVVRIVCCSFFFFMSHYFQKCS